MAKLIWDNIGERLYETGVDKVVLFLKDENNQYSKGVAWNGVSKITDSPSGAESNPLYADNIKYVDLISAEEYTNTIEAYTYPDEFEPCQGIKEISNGVSIGQQDRTAFGLVWRTVLGNASQKNAYGYKIHIMYNGIAAPTETPYESINDSPDALTMSWEVSTTPVNIPNIKPSATIVIDSTKADPYKLSKLENILYGTETEDSRLPFPDEIIDIMEIPALRVYAKNGYIYRDRRCIRKVSAKELSLMFSVSNIIIVDDNYECNPVTLLKDSDTYGLMYFIIDTDSQSVNLSIVYTSN